MERIERKDVAHATEPLSKLGADPGRAPVPQPPKVRLLLAWLVILVGAFVVLRSAKLETSNPSVGKKTDWQWEMTDLNGEAVNLKHYQGQPVLLNIWATWCPPCVSELPTIARLSRDPKITGSGVRILCVSLGEKREDVQDFKRRRPDNLLGPRFLVANTPPSPEFRTEGIPATFLIAPDGTIVESRLGLEDWSRPEMIDRVAALGKLGGRDELPPIEPNDGPGRADGLAK